MAESTSTLASRKDAVEGIDRLKARLVAAESKDKPGFKEGLTSRSTLFKAGLAGLAALAGEGDAAKFLGVQAAGTALGETGRLQAQHGGDIRSAENALIEAEIREVESARQRGLALLQSNTDLVMGSGNDEEWIADFAGLKSAEGLVSSHVRMQQQEANHALAETLFNNLPNVADNAKPGMVQKIWALNGWGDIDEDSAQQIGRNPLSMSTFNMAFMASTTDPESGLAAIGVIAAAQDTDAGVTEEVIAQAIGKLRTNAGVTAVLDAKNYTRKSMINAAMYKVRLDDPSLTIEQVLEKLPFDMRSDYQLLFEPNERMEDKRMEFLQSPAAASIYNTALQIAEKWNELASAVEGLEQVVPSDYAAEQIGRYTQTIDDKAAFARLQVFDEAYTGLDTVFAISSGFDPATMTEEQTDIVDSLSDLFMLGMPDKYVDYVAAGGTLGPTDFINQTISDMMAELSGGGGTPQLEEEPNQDATAPTPLVGASPLIQAAEVKQLEKEARAADRDLRAAGRGAKKNTEQAAQKEFKDKYIRKQTPSDFVGTIPANIAPEDVDSEMINFVHGQLVHRLGGSLFLTSSPGQIRKEAVKRLENAVERVGKISGTPQEQMSRVLNEVSYDAATR